MADTHPLYGPDSSILITGASSGIGAALAVEVARYGGRIALFARREERLHDVAERVAAAGAESLVLAGDVRDPAQVKEAYERMVREHGAPRVAFLNAGVGDSFAIGDFKAHRVRRIFEVNIMGVAHWLEHLLPPMLKKGRGFLVGISSLAAHRGGPMAGAYSASKAALSNLLESLRVEAGPAGVSISTVEPGFVRSELTDKNKFSMPFLMETDVAAALIVDQVAEGRTMIRFPWQMAAFVKLMKHLPMSVYDRMARHIIKGAPESLKSKN
ncbi:MAG: SDR family NAD(P)-dependent oxidoreductase [Deltaproteobacteria bacterium]|nr:SDR family NAD(P)-dependent oxidoreductase [Deltaproteobacteria bacterium]